MARHEGIIPPWPDRAELRSFAKIMAIGFGALALIFGLITRSLLPVYWLVGIGGGVALLSLLAPPLAAPVYMVWHTVTGAIGWVNTHIILSLLFAIAFVPTGLILKLLRKDPLHRRIDRGQASYWSDRDRNVDKDRYERQF